MQEVLQQNILRFWSEQMVDHENGGFYGRMDGHGRLHPEAEKGAILNARILWTFSAAYRVLREAEYLKMATYAKDYFVSHFIDREYGGVYWSVDCKGRPLNTRKQFYALGFALYGLSEYYRATGDGEALREALRLYQCIEEHAYDHQYGGYIEATARDWSPIADMRLSPLDANFPKSQNTHLHIIEPYTNLYRALSEAPEAPLSIPEQSSPTRSLSPEGDNIALSVDSNTNEAPRGSRGATRGSRGALHSSLKNLIDIFTTRILNPETHHLDLFFEMDWTRGAGHLESYGHDIECSWLMHEAALVLGDEEVLRRVEPIVRMVAEASEKGLRPDGSMIHEANLDTGHVDDDLHWWVQAENVVGWFNLYQHFGDETALARAVSCWQYIKQQLIDYENGEWYWSRHADGTLNRDDDHAGFWKCPYHNGRMCLELMERINTLLAVPPSP